MSRTRTCSPLLWVSTHTKKRDALAKCLPFTPTVSIRLRRLTVVKQGHFDDIVVLRLAVDVHQRRIEAVAEVLGVVVVHLKATTVDHRNGWQDTKEKEQSQRPLDCS